MTARRVLLPFTIPYYSLQRVEHNPGRLLLLGAGGTGSSEGGQGEGERNTDIAVGTP